MPDDLPVLEVLPSLLASLAAGTGAVLIAPPGAGKTTAIAPALLAQEWCTEQVIVTSPRRVAARAAAERMADLMGEAVGQTVGYVTRLDSRRSAATRILVVSEAVLVNWLVEDPDLAQVSAILFDEAHERHLDVDLGLGLALETRAVLRPDLRLVVMSATIDGERFAGLLGDDAPLITSTGKAHPLQLRWLGSAPSLPLEDAMTQALLHAWRDESGDILAFLPGVREIARVEERLAVRLPGVPVLPLHGQLEPAAQRAAIRRDEEGRRRIVLATSIAETSLTLDGVSVVVDSGLSRRAQFDRLAGTTHLVTVRASQAAASQRAGRACRQRPGVAYRLWEEAAHAGRPAFDPPEVLTADLAPLLLKLAAWGTGDPATLSWIDPPPAPSIAAARAALAELAALDGQGRLTAEGAQLAALPVDPQAAAMILFGARHGAAQLAARLALLLQEQGLGGRDPDLSARLARWHDDGSSRAAAARRLADNWARQAERLVEDTAETDRRSPPLAAIMAAGRPGFVARRRSASGERWLAANGRGFVLDPADPLARHEFLVIGDATGQAQGARILMAVALDRGDVDSWLAHRIVRQPKVQWVADRVVTQLECSLGALILERQHDADADEQEVLRLLVGKAVDNLPLVLPASLLARARFAGVASLSTEKLRQSAGEWLAPLLVGRRDIHVSPEQAQDAVLGLLSWEDRQRLTQSAPTHFATPAGTTHAIDYTGPDAPAVEVRVQALFGLDVHPRVGAVPLLLKLTSPASRPVQATRDLPGFWRGSWAEVRKEMKGRYPKHRWPDEPWREEPSLKTKNAFAAEARGTK